MPNKESKVFLQSGFFQGACASSVSGLCQISRSQIEKEKPISTLQEKIPTTQHSKSSTVIFLMNLKQLQEISSLKDFNNLLPLTQNDTKGQYVPTGSIMNFKHRKVSPDLSKVRIFIWQMHYLNQILFFNQSLKTKDCFVSPSGDTFRDALKFLFIIVA